MKKLLFIIALILNLNSFAQIYVPNSFTPNNDGINDYIKVYTQDSLTFFNFKIYNTQGVLIFNTFDVNKVWDGGDEYYSPNGLYVYMLEWSKSREIQVQRGYINLIR